MDRLFTAAAGDSCMLYSDDRIRRIGCNTARLALLSILLITASVTASAVTVRCGTTPGPGEYATLQAAVDYWRANPSLPNKSIDVYGTCNEAVVADVDGLSINGRNGAKLIAPPSTMAAIAVNGANKFSMWDMTVEGGSLAAVHFLSANGLLGGCVMQGATNGLSISNGSFVDIRASEMKNNSGAGLFVDSGSTAIVMFGTCQNCPSTTRITGNGNGVSLTHGFVKIWGPHEISGNTKMGITAMGGHLYLAAGPKIEQNGSNGISLNGTDATLQGPVAVRNSLGGAGLTASGGSVVRLRNGVIIEDNKGYGINLRASTLVATGTRSTPDHTLVQRNGAGLLASLGSRVSLSDSEVKNNAGTAAYLDETSSMHVINSLVSGNSGNGIQVVSLSTVRVFSGNVISGNSGVDLLCSPNSVGTGEQAGIGKMVCPGFQANTTPGPDLPDID